MQKGPCSSEKHRAIGRKTLFEAGLQKPLHRNWLEEVLRRKPNWKRSLGKQVLATSEHPARSRSSRI